MKLENPKATNGIVMEIGTRPGKINQNVKLRYVKVNCNGSVKFFEITKSNWSPFKISGFQNPWNQIHDVTIGEQVLLLHGDSNRNDMQRELFIGYAVAK